MELEKYTCNCCGKEHTYWPALGYLSPLYYAELSKEEQGQAELTDDTCIIYHPDRTDRFIRCTLNIQVGDHCNDLEYGLWMSVSEKSFNDYIDNWNNESHETAYFGMVSNKLIGYESTLSVHADVNTRTGGKRPEVVPHEDYDHQLVRDYYEGIKKVEAERRIKEMIESLTE